MSRSEEDRQDRVARECLRDGGGFRRGPLAGGVVLRDASLSDAQVVDAVRLHEERRRDPSGRGILKADRRAVVSAIETDAGPWCVKEFLRPRWNQRLQDRVQGSRARQSWLGAHACRVRGLATPRPLAALEARGRSWFVSERSVDGLELTEWVMRLHPSQDAGAGARWRALLDAVTDAVARLHGHRLRHRDLAAKNLLAREQAGRFEILLLDLSDVSLGRWPSRRFKIRNLGQLVQLPLPAPDADLERCFRRYLVRHPELDGPGVREEIRAIAQRRRESWLAHGGREWLRDHPGAAVDLGRAD